MDLPMLLVLLCPRNNLHTTDSSDIIHTLKNDIYTYISRINIVIHYD